MLEDINSTYYNTLKAFCKNTDMITRYRDNYNGAAYIEPYSKIHAYITGGRTVVEILPELRGVPCSNIILAYCDAFNPSAIRITTGEICMDDKPYRITIYVDEYERIEKIEQEVPVLFGSGATMQHILKELKAEEYTTSSK